MGHEVTVCPDGNTAIAALERNTYDCLLVDLDMPGASGIEVISRAKEMSPDADAIVLTGKSSIETAVAALRHGAYDYLTKPCRLAELESLLSRVAKKRELTNKYRAIKRQLEKYEGHSQLIGQSNSIKQVRSLISKVAPTNSTVLIRGETGTGKELVARAVHDQSARSAKPFVAINCGALPDSLIDSELFGHRKGAFTGADDHRMGLFEVANGGTLFLDEIAELPKATQSKLLRALESGEIRRLGDNQPFQVDVRVVCATHRALEEMVEQGDFREDLMFRVNTFEIRLAPLRERADDIAELANHLFRRLRGSVPTGQKVFSPEVIGALCAHEWSGNVRELANVIEYATIVCDELPIMPAHLPHRLTSAPTAPVISMSGPSLNLRQLEAHAIEEALRRHDGHKPEAAEELGISLKTLYNRLGPATKSPKAA